MVHGDSDPFEQLHLLLVEDDAADARLVEVRLSAGFARPPELSIARTLADGLEIARAKSIDLALLDLSLPDGRGVASVGRFVENGPSVPVIVLTGLDDERTATEALQLGAQDYLIKGDFNARGLNRAIRYALQRHRLAEHSGATEATGPVLDRQAATAIEDVLRSVATLQQELMSTLPSNQAGLLVELVDRARQLEQLTSTRQPQPNH